MACRISILALGFITILSIPVVAETIHLRSGRTITGSIIERADDHIKIDLNGVALTYYNDDIQNIDVSPPDLPTIQSPRSRSLNSSQNISDLIEKVSRSVVVVEAKKENSKTEGTGFFISTDGLIITNLHVIFKATSILIRTKNGKTYPVEFVANYDEDLDLCLLKIAIVDVPALPLGDSDALKAGQIIFTIGHREGSYYQTASGPYVGKKTIDTEENLQSKIVTGHGNSGGPLLDQQGIIIGISKAYSPDIGHNFGIPINAAKKFLNYNSLVSVEDFNKQISPANQLTYTGQGSFLAGKYGEALNYFKQALALDPDYFKAWNGCAKAYSAMSMESEAFNAWKEVYKRDPENALAYIRLGKIYLNRNMLTEAISHLENAVRLTPQAIEIYGDLGFAYGQKGMFTEAITAYKKALEFNPQDANSQYNLAVAYFNKRDFSLAKKSCDKAIDLGYAVPDSFLTQINQAQKIGNIFVPNNLKQ